MTDGVDLARAILPLPVAELQRVARRYLPDSRLPVRKDGLVAAIGAALASPERLDAVVARLSPLEAELLRELARRGGTADAWALATHAALRGLTAEPDARGGYAFQRWLDRSGAGAYLTPLVDDGLLVRDAGRAAFDRRAEARLGADPRLLARLRPGPPAPPTPLDVPTLDGAVAPVAPHPLAVVLEVIDAAHLVLDLGGVPVTRAGAIARPFVRRAERERPLRAARMETLLVTLFAAGLLRPPAEPTPGVPARPWTVDREALAALLRLPPYLAYAAVVDATCRTNDPRVDERWDRGLYGAAPASALRRAVFDALPALPPHPVAVESAAAVLWSDVLVHVFGWAGFVDASGAYGRQQPGEVAAVLEGVCARLGLLAVGDAPPSVDGPVGAAPRQVLAPALGARWYAVARARLLGHAAVADDAAELGARAAVCASGPPASGPTTVPPGAPDGSAPLLVQPNFEVHAYLDRLDAAAVAALTCATATRIDAQTATFEIDRRSVGRALDLGRDVEGVLADLRAHAGAVPANVERTIRDWAARRDRLRVTLGARLVEYADAAARDAALASLAGARAVGERFALLGANAPAPAATSRTAITTQRGFKVQRGFTGRG
ncbi:MAG: helicase-associated domain-containing protein [Trueperaceae bacterium]